MRLTVLVDADNVSPARLQPVLDLLAPPGADLGVEASGPIELIAGGRPQALAGVRWPAGARLLEHSGWQRADIALAAAYTPSDAPLVLVSGDGDFGLLAARHPGPVLVVSGAPSGRLRDHAFVVDPVTEGTGPIRSWLAAHGVD